MSAWKSTPELVNEREELRTKVRNGIIAVPLLTIVAAIVMAIVVEPEVGRAALVGVLWIAGLTWWRLRRLRQVHDLIAQRMVADPTHLSDFHRAMGSSLLPPPDHTVRRSWR